MKKGVMSVLTMIAGVVTGVAASAATVGKKQSLTIKRKQQFADKHLAIMKVYSQWLSAKQDGKSLTQYFEKNGYHDIAIYGMSYLGESLVKGLQDSGINIKYGIDKNAENLYSSVEILNVNDDLPEVDAIVVTAVFFFDEIEEELEELVDYPIISLEDVIYEV